MNSHDSPTFAITTLGCKVNQYETQAMREKLLRSGFLETENPRRADIYIVNSCTVTEKADKETRNLIRRFRRANPSGEIVVAGCYAESPPDRKTLESIAGDVHLMRNSEKARITEGAGITGFGDRNRAFIKAQDGCDHRCSYCKVRLVRGRSRSRSIGAVEKEAEALLGGGFKEIVLTGICLGAWGRDFKKKKGLLELVKRITAIKGKFRIRLSSIEPIYVTDSLIYELEKNKKLCKHLHIPLQSGDDKILKLMKRPYSRKTFLQIVETLRRHIPDIAITTDVLVGFPGEDNRSFRKTLELIKRIKPSRMHIFSYSKREGTAASRLECAPIKAVVKKRTKILAGLARKFSQEFAARFIGRSRSVVIENDRESSRSLLRGYTDNYIRIFAEGSDSLKNQLISATIVRLDREIGGIFARLDNGNIM